MPTTAWARRSSSTSGALVVVLAALWVGGGAAWRAWEHGGGRPVRWRDLSSALQAPLLPRPTVIRIDDSAQLAGRLRTAEPGREPSVPRLRPNEDAILLSTGPRSSTAYAIEVLGLREERGRLVVRARERAPTLARPGTARLVSPVVLLAVPEIDKPLAVEWDGR
jgi:hypothetical protein